MRALVLLLACSQAYALDGHLEAYAGPAARVQVDQTEKYETTDPLDPLESYEFNRARSVLGLRGALEHRRAIATAEASQYAQRFGIGWKPRASAYLVEHVRLDFDLPAPMLKVAGPPAAAWPDSISLQGHALRAHFASARVPGQPYLDLAYLSLNHGFAGPELGVGASLRISKRTSLWAEYRALALRRSNVEAEAKLSVDEWRLGVRVSLGAQNPPATR